MTPAEAAEWQARMRAACDGTARRRAAERAERTARAARRARGLEARLAWRLTRLDAREATRDLPAGRPVAGPRSPGKRARPQDEP